MSATRKIVCAATLCTLAACNGAGTFAQPPAKAPAITVRATRVQPQTYPTDRTLLFEGDTGNQYVAIYKAGRLKKNPLSIALITDDIYCPEGMALDKKGTLYVANGCGSTPEVTEYPKGSTTHTVAITDGINYPSGLAIDKNGTLYVTSYPAAIVEYAYGTTEPLLTISGQGLSDPYGLALDKQNNLYIADSDAHAVFKVPYGTTTVENLNLQDLDTPVNVKFDKSGNLWESDNGNNYSKGYVNVYPPDSQTPSQTITGFGYPYALSIDNRGTAVVGNVGYPEAVYAYKPGEYTPYATLTTGISEPTGLLIARP